MFLRLTDEIIKIAILCTKRDAGVSNSQIGIELGKTNQACRSAMHKHKEKPHCDCRTVVRSMTMFHPKFTPINTCSPRQTGYVGGSTTHSRSSPTLLQDMGRSHPQSSPQRATLDSRNTSMSLPSSSNASPNRVSLVTALDMNNSTSLTYATVLHVDCRVTESRNSSQSAGTIAFRFESHTPHQWQLETAPHSMISNLYHS